MKFFPIFSGFSFFIFSLSSLVSSVSSFLYHHRGTSIIILYHTIPSYHTTRSSALVVLQMMASRGLGWLERELWSSAGAVAAACREMDGWMDGWMGGVVESPRQAGQDKAGKERR